MHEKCAALGAESATNDPGQFGEEVRSLVDYWAPIVKAAAIPQQ